MIPSSEFFKNQFQLDSAFIYLNHGSFGACPKPIFKERNKWQLEIERQPVSFIEDKAIKLLDWSRQELASFIHCDKDDVVYFPNPTTAMHNTTSRTGWRAVERHTLCVGGHCATFHACGRINETIHEAAPTH